MTDDQLGTARQISARILAAVRAEADNSEADDGTDLTLTKEDCDDLGADILRMVLDAHPPADPDPPRPRAGGYTDQLNPAVLARVTAEAAREIRNVYDGDDATSLGCAEAVVRAVLLEFRPDLFTHSAPRCGKYGTPEVWLAKLFEDEPFFGLRARDTLSLMTLGYYRQQLRDAKLLGHADQVTGLISAFIDWQLKNPEKTKNPD